MMLFSYLVKKRALAARLLPLLLLLVLTGCSSLFNASNPPKSGTATATLPPIPTTSSSYLTSIRPFINTTNGIHLFQSFDYHIDDPASIARYYDFVWGANPNKVAIYRANNPSIFLSFYISFFRDSGAFGNQDAAHDLAYWQRVHPDWILYQCDRTTPAYEDGLPNIPFNFTNPAFIAWQVQTYAQPASQNGYDAIAADNVNMENLIGACGYYKNGKWVHRYSGNIDDPQWRADVASWVTTMQQDLRRLRHPLALIPNLGLSPSFSPTDSALQQVVNHVDGIVDEGGFTEYAQGYLTGSQWVQKVNFIQSVQRLNKAYYIENEFPSVGRNEIQWALASYLMCKEQAAAVAITTVQGYGVDARYNEYSAQIGSPLGDMAQQQHVYWRTFTHGLSLVNPDAQNTYMVTLPAGQHFVDLYGNTMGQQVSLPPHSGLVLLSTAA